MFVFFLKKKKLHVCIIQDLIWVQFPKTEPQTQPSGLDLHPVLHLNHSRETLYLSNPGSGEVLVLSLLTGRCFVVPNSVDTEPLMLALAESRLRGRQDVTLGWTWSLGPVKAEVGHLDWLAIVMVLFWSVSGAESGVFLRSAASRKPPSSSSSHDQAVFFQNIFGPHGTEQIREEPDRTTPELTGHNKTLNVHGVSVLKPKPTSGLDREQNWVQGSVPIQPYSPGSSL